MLKWSGLWNEVYTVIQHHSIGEGVQIVPYKRNQPFTEKIGSKKDVEPTRVK